MATSFFGGAFFGGEFFNSGTPTPPFGRDGLGGDDVPRRESPHRGWDKKEWKRRVKDHEDAVEADLRETYNRLVGLDAPVSQLAQVDAIVRPVAQRDFGSPRLQIDWAALAADYERAQRLYALERERAAWEALLADDDEMVLFS